MEINVFSKNSDTGPLVTSGDGNYPHEIRVDNMVDRGVTVIITVNRDGSEVYNETHEIAAQTQRVVAGFTENSLPKDTRSVTVTATSGNGQSTDVDVSISDCLGDIVFFYRSNGKLESTYSTC